MELVAAFKQPCNRRMFVCHVQVREADGATLNGALVNDRELLYCIQTCWFGQIAALAQLIQELVHPTPGEESILLLRTAAL